MTGSGVSPDLGNLRVLGETPRTARETRALPEEWRENITAFEGL